jgi:hypothetical protein
VDIWEVIALQRLRVEARDPKFLALSLSHMMPVAALVSLGALESAGGCTIPLNRLSKKPSLFIK